MWTILSEAGYIIVYKNGNKPKDQQTGNPEKYPQKYFNCKICGVCKKGFTPRSPSELYCSDKCKDWAASDKYLKRTYGMSKYEYDELHNNNRKCEICGSVGFILNKDSKIKLVIDHCHHTNEIRGILCHNCNRALGLFKDSITNLKKAIEYLERATTIPKGSTQEVLGKYEPSKDDDIV